MNLYDLGWSDQYFVDGNDKSLVPARIIGVEKGLYLGLTANGSIRCQLGGRFQFHLIDSSELPVVGDWCWVTPPFEGENGEQGALIQSVLERKSYISRMKNNSEQVLVSNVDQAFVVTSANDEFNINRLQRYVMMSHQGRVNPIIVLTKADLSSDIYKYVKEVERTFKEIEILVTSAMDQPDKASGLDEIKKNIGPGTTSVFIGSSGVGKSTLVNCLLGDEQQCTQQIRSHDSKGRHTTTSRHLFILPGGGMIIDTPGLKLIEVFGDAESIDETFDKVSGLIKRCRFKNCTHQNEPGCAILHALDDGEISQGEVDNFHKLRKEAEFANSKMDKQLTANRKRKFKHISKLCRERRKVTGR